MKTWKGEMITEDNCFMNFDIASQNSYIIKYINPPLSKSTQEVREILVDLLLIKVKIPTYTS